MSAHRSTPVNRNELGDVRYWLEADIQRGSTERPVLVLKRTSPLQHPSDLM